MRATTSVSVSPSNPPPSDSPLWSPCRREDSLHAKPQEAEQGQAWKGMGWETTRRPQGQKVDWEISKDPGKPSTASCFCISIEPTA